MTVSFESTSVRLLAKLTAEVTDPASWDRFVYTYGPQILQWCLDHGLQEADAQDVCQEVMLRIARQIPQMQYDPQRSFRGWLFFVIRGAWADWVKDSRALIDRREGLPGLSRLAAADAELDLLTRFEGCYQEELLEKASRHVRRRVTPATWQAFELVALRELSIDEVSQRLRMTRGAVAAARCRVQKLLREEVERQEGAP